MPPPAPTHDATAASPTGGAHPASLRALFIAFTLLALQGFGGVLAVVQREVVERHRWLTRQQFLEEWAVAQVMPGPNVINLALILGDRFFGWRGAVVAVLGLLAAPLVVVWMLAMLYGRYAQLAAVAGALRGMAAVAAGMVIATGLKLLPALRTHVLGPPLCGALALACFVGVAGLRWPLIAVLLGLGLLSCVLTYRRLPP